MRLTCASSPGRGTDMKTLCALLLLAALGCSLGRARNVSVCELTAQLRGAAANCSRINASDPAVLARIVCHADILSNLSTSARTNETHVFRDPGKGANSGKNQDSSGHGENQDGGHHGENQDGGHHGGNQDGGHHGGNQDGGGHGENQSQEAQSGGGKGGPRRRSRSFKGSGFEQTRPGSSSPPPPQQNCTLYGVFQLSSCQACNDGVTPTKNICNLNCSELLDDDISNDAICLFKVTFSKDICTNRWQEWRESLGKNQKNQSGQCSNVSAYMC
ncbi:keratin, type I cytoskeletal 10-like [Betta splendens]|uniref:lysozyme n=1 Tax=Betta splendens TaxID=158456 RepID=A0A6P7N0P0_BETSP|nr:keratin, type I cytoskeletal 10-like [Betta splendens]